MTLYLIASNVYNSVEGPFNRGFSYIEIWMIGAQFPILVAIFEYGVLLSLKKYVKSRGDIHKVESDEQETSDTIIMKNIDEVAKKVDKVTFFSLLIFITLFNVIYWCGVI